MYIDSSLCSLYPTGVSTMNFFTWEIISFLFFSNVSAQTKDIILATQINYIGQLIETYLNHCSTVLFLDGYKVSDAHFVSILLESKNWQQDYYLYYNNPEKRNASHHHNFMSALDVHKWRHECTQVIMFLNIPSESRIEQAYNSMRRMRGIILKNHDYFIFPTRSTWTHTVLKSKLGLKITHKIAVESHGLAIPHLKTVCIYCDHGNPLIIELDRNLRVSEIFLDLMKNFHGKTFQVSIATGKLDEFKVAVLNARQ